ncbi:serine hydrolase domain-containing protein [Roseateles koreensis]|uniref:Serine hydrolase n=1 Tax=Roseateles koreensis TaxID=2987526 RepID=A0ABT5KRM2_9BURK|nr:serine hydrolase [Roseateles koreensis]MDC8784521.1 serine hydrolase [Roseateles koreensis]
MFKLHQLALIPILLGGTALHAADLAKAPPAITDVPSQVGVMVGAPPTAENQVTLRNSISPRFIRWTLMHMSTLANTTRISRGTDMPMPLPQGKPLDVDALSVEWQGKQISVAEAYRILGADSLMVLHRGRVVYERYIGDMTPDTLHATNSCTKSLIGTLVVILAHEGKLDLAAPASRYLPEIASSAVGSATLQELLDMRANFKLGDDVHVGGSIQVAAQQAYGMFPRPKDYAGPDGAMEMVLASRPTTAHGTGPFRYDNVSTETLGWILHRVSGKSVPDLISERFWQPIGAEQDGDFLLDTRKTPIAAFGLQANMRDMVRFAEMIRNDGRVGNKQVVPAAVIGAIRRGGDRAAFAASADGPILPNGSYHDQWWLTHDEFESFQCQGQFAQRFWIAPKAETVIGLYSTDPDTTRTREPLRSAVFKTIARALNR